MHKDFDRWNDIKKATDARSDTSNVYFKEREVWWCKLGVNIGFEQNGKGDMSQRPVVIMKKFNRRVFIAVPLSTKIKDNPHYLNLSRPIGPTRSAIVSQLRMLDVKRLIKKIYTLPASDYDQIRKAIIPFFE